ncbi:MAG: hypothetical protein EOO33_06370 [Comamonadaceae bacterium]|nr:MAG: hypothetical protein EOO33_06370 [Comamonadaceae bacterium]
MTKRSWKPLAACASLALVAGCSFTSDLPEGQAHPVSTQKTSRAVHHWDVMADDVATHVADRLREWPAGEHPIHVVVGPDESGFNTGFRQLLVTRLVERGLALSTEPTAVLLKVDTQLVQHHAGAAPTSSGMRLADNVQVVRSPMGYVPAAAPMWVSTGPMRTEILVTTSLERDQRYLVRTSSVYSIPQDDAALYQARVPAPVPQPTPVKTWRVTP